MSARGRGKNAINRLGAELLKQIHESGKGERFKLAELQPAKAASYSCAFDNLLEFGYAERVQVRCGEWYYRITPKGIAVAEGNAGLLLGDAGSNRDSQTEPTQLGVL